MESKEISKLKSLAVFHYILGGIGVLFAFLPVIHFAIGMAMLSGFFPMDHSEETPVSPRLFGLLFAVLGGVFFLVGQVMAWCTIYSGRMLKRQKKHTFSFVVACTLCTFVPLGTILGVFTIITLQDPEVKKLYPSTSV